jgi:hypothetical protein
MANFRHRVPLLVEILRNTALFASEGFGSATVSSSGSRCCQSCLGSLPNGVSLKLRKRAKDMENELAPAGGGINVLREAFKPNAPLLRAVMGEGAPQPV